jgi:hypothetical protein
MRENVKCAWKPTAYAFYLVEGPVWISMRKDLKSPAILTYINFVLFSISQFYLSTQLFIKKRGPLHYKVLSPK